MNVYFNGPLMEEGNRVVRNFENHIGQFMRVVFEVLLFISFFLRFSFLHDAINLKRMKMAVEFQVLDLLQLKN